MVGVVPQVPVLPHCQRAAAVAHLVLHAADAADPEAGEGEGGESRQRLRSVLFVPDDEHRAQNGILALEEGAGVCPAPPQQQNSISVSECARMKEANGLLQDSIILRISVHGVSRDKRREDGVRTNHPPCSPCNQCIPCTSNVTWAETSAIFSTRGGGGRARHVQGEGMPDGYPLKVTYACMPFASA